MVKVQRNIKLCLESWQIIILYPEWDIDTICREKFEAHIHVSVNHRPIRILYPEWDIDTIYEKTLRCNIGDIALKYIIMIGLFPSLSSQY
jgi:hypothetical protein